MWISRCYDISFSVNVFVFRCVDSRVYPSLHSGFPFPHQQGHSEKHGLSSHQDGHQSIFIGISVISCDFCTNICGKPDSKTSITIYGFFRIHSGVYLIGMVGNHCVYRGDGSVTTPLSPCND